MTNSGGGGGDNASANGSSGGTGGLVGGLAGGGGAGAVAAAAVVRNAAGEVSSDAARAGAAAAPAPSSPIWPHKAWPKDALALASDNDTEAAEPGRDEALAQVSPLRVYPNSFKSFKDCPLFRQDHTLEIRNVDAVCFRCLLLIL